MFSISEMSNNVIRSMLLVILVTTLPFLASHEGSAEEGMKKQDPGATIVEQTGVDATCPHLIESICERITDDLEVEDCHDLEILTRGTDLRIARMGPVYLSTDQRDVEELNALFVERVNTWVPLEDLEKDEFGEVIVHEFVMNGSAGPQD
jgi:hypothetical protein